MTALQSAALYIGLFAILFFALKMNCGRARSGAKVSIGDGGNESLQRAMRTQANAVEDVPIILLGLLALGALDVPATLVHGIGGSFLVFRLLHALGMGGAKGFQLGRLVGTIGTLLIFLATIVSCVLYAFL